MARLPVAMAALLIAARTVLGYGRHRVLRPCEVQPAMWRCAVRAMGAPTDTVVGTMAVDIRSVLPQRVWRRGWPLAQQQPQRRGRTTHRRTIHRLTTHRIILDAQGITITRLGTLSGCSEVSASRPTFCRCKYDRVTTALFWLGHRTPARASSQQNATAAPSWNRHFYQAISESGSSAAHVSQCSNAI